MVTGPSSDKAPMMVTPRLMTSAPFAGRMPAAFNSVITHYPRTTVPPRPRRQVHAGRKWPFSGNPRGSSVFEDDSDGAEAGLGQHGRYSRVRGGRGAGLDRREIGD